MGTNGEAVTLVWNDGMRFEARTEAGARITVDGEGAEGPSPVLLLLESLGACTALDVVEILRKGRQELRALRVQVTGRRRADPPRRFTELGLRFELEGPVDRAKAERAVELSLDRYCSVLHTLDPALRENLRVTLELEAQPAQ